jgi:propionyl-CoA synthetase
MPSADLPVTYDEAYHGSLADPEHFWLEAASALDWERIPTRARDESANSPQRWFPDGTLNITYNALDRHVKAGRGAAAALIYDSPVTGTKRVYSYSQLVTEVAQFAGALAAKGVRRGDRVAIYMPMVPEAVIAMLATARLGAIHTVVFGGFAAAELASRLDDARPTVVVSASCGIEGSRIVEYKPILDRAIELAAHKPQTCIILQRPQHLATLNETDIRWDAALTDAVPQDAVPVSSTDPLYILYTSGTTGKPKGVVRDTGGYATALLWSMANIFDVQAGDTCFTASDVGWVVGHSYIVYGPLLCGAATVLYEGKPVGTPDPGQFWRVIEEHRVRSVFTAPTAIRAIKREDPRGQYAQGYDLSSLRHLFLAGERLDPETQRWASDVLAVPVIDNWWQTETGWPVVANPVGLQMLPLKPGSPTKPMPGWRVAVLDPSGSPVPSNQDGAIALKLPLPPGALTTLWESHARFVDTYLTMYPGFYLTGDSGHLDEDGYLFVMGRTDDVINVAGHRLSTGEMEEVLASHPAVAECAVIAVPDDLKGHVPRGFVVTTVDAAISATDLQSELVQLVRDRIGAVAALRHISIVAALPKTRSGKILRKNMRDIAAGRDAPTPATIEDVSVLENLRRVLQTNEG